MQLSKIGIAFNILREVKKEISEWERKGLTEITSKEVYEVINQLRLFLEVKEEK